MRKRKRLQSKKWQQMIYHSDSVKAKKADDLKGRQLGIHNSKENFMINQHMLNMQTQN